MISLKRLIEQNGSESQYYDLGKDFANFKRTIDGSFEQVKQKYEQAIGSKLVGKRVRARASRGYKQYVKDYEFDVVKITLDDYYDNYVIVAHDNTTPKPKEYFLKPGFKVTILGPATGQPSPQKGGKPENDQVPKIEQPNNQQVTPQSNPDKAQSQPMTPAPAGNTSPTTSERPMEEDLSKNGHYDAYSIDTIDKDIKIWLPCLLKKQETSMRDFTAGLGWMKDLGHGKTVAMFDLKIPRDALRIKLTPEIVKNILHKISRNGSTIKTTYDLVKMDNNDEKQQWDIRIKKTTTDASI